MATTITVNEQDVKFAETFLTTYLTDKIVDADFSEGGVVRDFTVKAVAMVFAYLTKELKTVRDHQSLKRLAALPPGPDVDAAVDEILSNIFLERLGGSPARLPSTVLHFSRAVDVPLPAQTRFFRTANLVFMPESETVIPASELRSTVSADGTVVDYTATVALKAVDVGTEYNVTPGRFLSADPFNPYFLYAENVTQGVDGTAVETTQELLERAPTGIAVRNLVNERSIKTVLRQNFAGVKQVQVAGMGDVEMLRDRVPGGLGHLRLAVGGHTDIYVGATRTDVTETLTIGGFFVRPDGVVSVLRDPAGFAGVQPGHVLHIASGLPNTPMDFLIAAVGDDFVEVQTRNAFIRATDELNTYVSYSVGTLGPGFDNVIPTRTTGQTSRKVQYENSVILTGRPHYKLKRVEVVNGNTVTSLSTRVNDTPGVGEYQVVELNVPEAQSARAMTLVRVHDSHVGNLRVTYETLVDYAAIQSLAVDRFERVVCSNPLVKGMHPVYVGASFRYRLASTAQETVDEVAVAREVAAYINNHAADDNIDLSQLRQHIRNQFPQIGILYEPFTVTYELLAPDGQRYVYTTRDVISIRPDWPQNTARLTNGASLRTPIVNADLDPTISEANELLATAANELLQTQLANIGVSDRTIRYMADVADILVTKEG